MKFDRERLIDLIDDPIEKIFLQRHRWALCYKVIFEFEGKFYSTKIWRGATENQDADILGYQNGMIECPEVKKVQKTVDSWEVVEV